MANARKRGRQRRHAKSLIVSMREFLTPEDRSQYHGRKTQAKADMPPTRPAELLLS